MGFESERDIIGKRPSELFTNEWAYSGEATDQLVRNGDSVEYELSIDVSDNSDQDVQFQKARDLAEKALARLP